MNLEVALALSVPVVLGVLILCVYLIDKYKK
jgi:hypothetical protein